jgi:beta-glucuronidase
MIRPQRNACRQFADLSGVWHVAFDESDNADWSHGIPTDRAHAIAVPGSWNEQLAEAGFMNFCGAGWFETEVFLPPLAPGRDLALHFGSVDFYGEVWLGGQHIGTSSAPMLPFEAAIPANLATGSRARLVVRVDARLHPDEATQGITQATNAEDRRPRDEYLPAVRFDFFPYGGINRPVLLVERPTHGLIGWRASSDLAGVTLAVETSAGSAICARLTDDAGEIIAGATVTDGRADLRLNPAAPRLWDPGSPHLYRLDIDVLDNDGQVIDAASQQIGLRTFSIDGPRFCLNGQPILLKGFGKHEESPLHGRGLNMPQLVKDFHLLKWIGANSVRTSHYPYSEEFLDLADQFGVLVIDEVFSINLDFRRTNAATLANHKRAVSELIARDASRTCVIAWSLANEPGYLAEANYREASAPYWRELFAHSRACDPTRPMTHANVGYAGNDDPAFLEADFVGLNRYHGWYSNPGQIDAAVAALRADLDAVAVHGKPVMLLEFGADALAGQHATYDQLFTEEYQQRLITAYWAEIERHPATQGGHVWNFADFRTAQHGRRVVHNLKGVFTRTREPKMAAWALRRLWAGQGNGA